jgi:N-acetyl-anhydromuramyl-L-alanine amidase AmpD
MLIAKVNRPIQKVFIHCSASDNPGHDNIATIKKWHLERGFTDVGYHFFIRKSGKIEGGRPLNQIPAAQKDNNSGSIAICLYGLEKDKFTDEQFDALNALCDEIKSVYPNITFHGHCELSDKACPVFDYRQVLGLDKNGKRTIKE